MNNGVGYIAKRILMVMIVVCTTLLITVQLVMAAQKDNRATVFKWGDSTWTLANDGELISNGGDVGQAPPLYDVLSNNGIEPEQVKSIEFTKATSAHDITNMLGKLPNLQKITKLNNLNYSGKADQMFLEDKDLYSADFSDFETSKITSMEMMFYNTGFESLDLSAFNTSQVTSMYAMFDGASKLHSLNVENFNTNKVTNMSYMFYNIAASEVDLSSFNTSNVSNMEGMFDSTSKLNKLDLSVFDTSKATTMEYMFAGSAVSQLNISSFTIGDGVKTTGMLQSTVNLKQLSLGKKTN